VATIPIIGLDIGGANLKAAHSTGLACTVPFELWKSPLGLAVSLRALLEQFPPFNRVALTMTGELCDCFATKREGVQTILDQVVRTVTKPVQVWRTDERFVDVATAKDDPLPVAAANWLALAVFVGRWALHGPALLVDVGSTTTDVVPLLDAHPVPRGRTDPERLESQELVYTGVARTPLCALLGARGAAEWFATTLDAYLVLGHVAEDLANTNTADGRPATRSHAHARLARMQCADVETFSLNEACALAREVVLSQVGIIADAVGTVSATLPSPPQTIILSGSGEFIARWVTGKHKTLRQARLVSVRELLGPSQSQAACAVAVSALAGEQGP
jgi:probable H4MPT-linked C1 transfer pathway protein